MQKPDNQPSKFRLTSRSIFGAARFARRLQSHPDELEAFLAAVQDVHGASDADMETIGHTLRILLKLSKESGTTYALDIYLTAGMGAVDLVLLAILVPLGASDQPLFVATLALAISLVFVSWSLVTSFVKRHLGVAAYEIGHSNLISLALASGIAALTATFWHVSAVIGATILLLAIVALTGCAIYIIRLQGALISIKELDAKQPATDTAALSKSPQDSSKHGPPAF